MILSEHRRWGVWALALLLLCPVLALAQEAQVSGRILDPSGAAIPGAAVSITNDATGVKRVTNSNQEGNYAIPLLPPGNYSMVVQKDGFRPAKRNGVTLQVNDRVTLHFNMKWVPRPRASRWRAMPRCCAPKTPRPARSSRPHLSPTFRSCSGIPCNC